MANKVESCDYKPYDMNREPDPSGPIGECRYNCPDAEHVGDHKYVCLHSDHWNEEQSNTRRGFLTGAAAAIATGTAPQLAPDKSSSLKEMASALHDTIGQFSDTNIPTHVQVCADGRFLKLEIEPLQDCSVDEILEQLRPLYENSQGGAS